MSIISSLYAGASGVTAMSKSIQVIGNNIANANTVGFKGSKTEFGDLLSQSLTTPSGRSQVGLGVRTEAVHGVFNQGAFQSTSVVTDVALNGRGFFQLTSEDGETFYSRAGQFRIDKDGFLSNSTGMHVMGYEFDAIGNNTSGSPTSINLASVTAPPNPTGDGVASGTGAKLNINLSAGVEPLVDTQSGAAIPFDGTTAQSAADTSHFSTAMTVYDSLGIARSVLIYFNKITEASPGDPAAVPPVPATTNDWEWHATVDGSEVAGGTPGQLVEGGSGVLSFDANGTLSPASAQSQANFAFDRGASTTQQIGIDFSASTQVGNERSQANSITQDGYGPGTLQGVDIDREGILTGVFTNGVARNLSQFVVASFPAETGLMRLGDNLFVETSQSGQPIVSTANTGMNGTIAASTLELANVDMTEEFVDLISAQRAFQANTKIITTGDTLLETVINLKR